MAKKTIRKTESNQTEFFRAPIVTIMGHVDHGKTSILDAIRNSRITAKESGGITQHIGAYTVEKDGNKVTFIDTPGHEAFSQMRARGGAAADIVILVVAADDGVMPQTKEAITHAKAANVPIIVAVNKIDLPSADSMKVKRQLSESNLLVEGFGGDIPVVELSAKTGKGLNELLDVINLVSEMDKGVLKAEPGGNLEALVIESRHDAKRGIVVSVVVKNGTLKVRDDVYTPGTEGKIKSMMNSLGKSVTEALPGEAIEILGFTGVPVVGDVVYRKGEKPAESTDPVLEDESGSGMVILTGDKKKKLNLIIRADTYGTQEALSASLLKLSVEDAQVNILFAGTGEVKESDVLLASSSNAVVIAFRVKVPDHLIEQAKSSKIIIREHDIIYKVIEEIEGALEGVLEIEESKIKGHGLVIEKFVLPKSGDLIAGTFIEAGKFRLNNRVGIYRDGNDEVPVYVSRVRSIHIGKKEVEIAKKGEECGLLFKPPLEDIQLDDKIRVL